MRWNVGIDWINLIKRKL